MNPDKVKLINEDISTEDLNLFSKSSVLAVDCEMMGLNIHRDRLCLVQIADEEQNIRLIQISLNQKEAPNLKDLLESPNRTSLFHFARTDLAWLKEWLNIDITRYFCTKVASKLVRTYTDKHSLKELCRELIGKDISKQQQTSYWGAAILSKSQQNYAAYDVFYLHEIHEKILTMLERENKLDLALKCISFIKTFADLDTMGYSLVLEH